jgi:gamma-tubulin complex component 5
MDAGQAWNDFHFLNTAFGDVLEASSSKWVEASLVRLSFRGSKDQAINKTVRSINGLLMEYAVPFPLTYVFGPRVLQAYNSIFVFLVQIRRAKSVLERILVRGGIANSVHLGGDAKVLYAMRSKLSWFIKCVAQPSLAESSLLIDSLQHVTEFLGYICNFCTQLVKICYSLTCPRSFIRRP